MSAKLKQRLLGSKGKKITGLVILMAVLVFISILFYNPPVYAVTLDSNQVYFGNLNDNIFSDFLTLDNAYFIEQAPEASSTDGKPSYLVRRIENGLAGPRKKMRIEKSHVLMYQELRTDSQVMAAINQDKRRGR